MSVNGTSNLYVQRNLGYKYLLINTTKVYDFTNCDYDHYAMDCIELLSFMAYTYGFSIKIFTPKQLRGSDSNSMFILKRINQLNTKSHPLEKLLMRPIL